MIEFFRRRRMQVLAGTLLALVVVIVVVVAATGDDGQQLRATSATSTSTTVPEPTTSTTGIATATTVAKPKATAKPLAAKEKRCATATPQNVEPPPDNWAEHWQTKPDPNQPLTVQVCIDDATPAPTQRVTLTVTADDPDASIGKGDCDIHVDWEGNLVSLCRDTLVGGQGPQPTPAKEHGHVVEEYLHVYENAGPRTVEVTVWSSVHTGKPHPYSNYATVQLPISVN